MGIRSRFRRHVVWRPKVGDRVWVEIAYGIEPGIIEATKGLSYAVSVKGHLWVRTKSLLWPWESLDKGRGSITDEHVYVNPVVTAEEWPLHLTGEAQKVHVGWDGRSEPMYRLAFPCGCETLLDGRTLMRVSIPCLRNSHSVSRSTDG